MWSSCTPRPEEARRFFLQVPASVPASPWPVAYHALWRPIRSDSLCAEWADYCLRQARRAGGREWFGGDVSERAERLRSVASERSRGSRPVFRSRKRPVCRARHGRVCAAYGVRSPPNHSRREPAEAERPLSQRSRSSTASVAGSKLSLLTPSTVSVNAP